MSMKPKRAGLRSAVSHLTETGLADYLVLLGIFQTCRYRGAEVALPL